MLKKLIRISLTLMILLGGTGCMSNNDNEYKTLLKEQMELYAEEKYNEDFEVVSYFYAKRGLDAADRDILTLRIDNFVFNVYHYIEDEEINNLSDDYAEEIVNEKFRNKFKDHFGNKIDEYFNIDVLFTCKSDEDRKTWREDVINMSVEDIISKYHLMDIGFFYNPIVNKYYIEDNSTLFLEIQDYLKSYNPDSIRFIVVTTSKKNNEIYNTLSNARLLNNDEWESYDNVIEYVDIVDSQLSSKDELISYIKEVN